MNNSKHICMALLVVATLGLPATARANLTAYFDGGDSTEVVDAYVGVAGDGWQGPWVQSKRNNDTANSTIEVLEPGQTGYQELTTGWGNYLNIKAQGTVGSTDIRYAECRDYLGDNPAEFDPTRPHTVQFSVRINEDLMGSIFLPATFDTYDGDFYMVEDYPSAFNNSSSAMRWAVRVDGGEGRGVPALEWRFIGGAHDGGSFPEGGGTGITLEAGAVYDFTIAVDPTNEVEGIGLGTWVGSIVKNPAGGGTPTSYTGPTMGWRATLNEPGGYLCFINHANSSDDVRDWSIDNIAITQEYVPPVPGDTDGNGIVDKIDAATLAAHWLASDLTGGVRDGDFNNDGRADDLDLAILAANWGSHSPNGSTASVPEPSLVVFFLGATLLLLAWRRRRYDP